MSLLIPQLPPNFQAALRDVKARRPESRIAAAERLGRADLSERAPAIEGLSLLLADVHPGVRSSALIALGGLGADEVIALVIESLSDDAPGVRELAALAVAQIGGEQAIAALRDALRREAPEVRFQAVLAIAELSPETAVHDLTPLLKDNDPEVRAQVICGLSSLDDTHLSGHFAGALKDASPVVRLEAALALAAVGDARAEPILLAALEARERVVEVAQALAQLTSKQAIEPLARLAGSFFTAPYVRAGVGAALLKLGDPRGQSALRRVLTGLRSEARSYAVELVRETQAHALVPELTKLAARPRGADLLTVVDALATFASEIEPAHRALTALAARPDDVGERARTALKGTVFPENSLQMPARA